MAYAAARFTDSLIKGMNGQEGVVECAYIQSDVTEAKYFATPVVLGPNGVEKNLGLGTLTAYEQVLSKKKCLLMVRFYRHFICKNIFVLIHILSMSLALLC